MNKQQQEVRADKGVISPHVLDAIIIGSGFGGICQAIKLRKSGVHGFVILEKEKDLGGTWRDNTYPGAQCDIPSALYSYSFEATQHYNSYLGQPAILDYIRSVANKYKIAQHISYKKTVDRLKYDEFAHIWNVHTSEGQHYKARFVISAVGQLHHPKIPKIAGCEKFNGDSIHTAQFGLKKIENFVGKRVAVVGTGASAIQLIPPLQKVCTKVNLYQRTPSYILPKIGFSKIEEHIIAKYPCIRNLARDFLQQYAEILFSAIRGKSWAQKFLKKTCCLNLESKVRSAEKRKTLMPDYPIGTKRTLLSDEFYPAVDQSNVFIHSMGIKGIYDDGIINSDDSLTEVDEIIYATGFITNSFLHGISVIGRSNKELWKDEQGAHAFWGVMTTGFPNMFFLYGPNTNTGHASVIDFLEEQAEFVLRAMQHVKNNNHKSIEVKASVENKFNERVQKVSKDLTFAKLENSNYMHNGRLINNWIGTVGEYKAGLASIDFSEDFIIHGKDDSENYGVLLDMKRGSKPESLQTHTKAEFCAVASNALMRIPVYSIMIASQIIRTAVRLTSDYQLKTPSVGSLHAKVANC